jgi:RNA polymerase sigma-70 factor (ECF subfamily)
MDAHLTETRQSRETAGTSVTALDDATWVFVRARPGLLALARQILGNAHEAEDVIQETWLRWQGADRTAVSNPSALLRTTTVRLAINVVQSAWKRRESCVGPSFPDRMDCDANPEAVAERQDAVERAVLLLMETLTPRQRAAYVLREGFGYPYDRIAETLHLSVVNTCRQVRAGAGSGSRRPQCGREDVHALAEVREFLAQFRDPGTKVGGFFGQRYEGGSEVDAVLIDAVLIDQGHHASMTLRVNNAKDLKVALSFR